MEKINYHSKGLILAVVSAICWGTYGTFLTLLTRAGIRQMTLVALVPTFIMMYGFLGSIGKQKSILKVKPKIMVFMVAHGLVVTNSINFCYVKAVKTVPISIVSIMSFSSVIVVMLASRVLFKYSLTQRKILAILGALFGISLILRVFDSGRMLNLTGIGLALCIPVLAGMSSILYRYYMNNDTDEDIIMFWVNLSAAAFCWFSTPPWLMAVDVKHAMETSTQPMTVVLGLAGFCLIPLVICYYTYFQAYKHVEPTYVSLCYALEPATASVLGFFFLGQRLGATQLLGIGIVIGAILYIQLGGSGKSHAAEAAGTAAGINSEGN